NAGSTSLTHSITGLTNGTSYTFTVKATNSAGASLASLASNSVIPQAPVASTFAFTGPSTGNVNSASANFTVTPNNTYTGIITVTPSGVGSAGLSAKVLTFTNSSTAQTFTIAPTVAGSITLTPTNSGSLTNPANLLYTTNAVVSGAPTSVIAVAGNASA
ncbi:fibronectin type III domain-containing protein, partial [bacterium]|nr:fibronectin type III domain-containing protein [bacterium]